MRIKPVLQQDLKDCGVCSISYIINYYDGYIPLEKIREDTLTDLNGTTFYHMINALNKYGFDAVGIKEEDISKIKSYPSIVHMNYEGYYHFEVLIKITKDKVYLMDPAKGYKTISREEFLKHFTYNILLIHPREKILKLSKGITISKLFKNILSKEKLLIFKIIILSIFLILFTLISTYYLKISSDNLSNIDTLNKIVLIFLIITILKIFISFLREYYENKLNYFIDNKLYNKFITHLLKLPIRSIKSRTTGELLTRINDISLLKSLFSSIFVSVFLDSFMLIFALIILFILNKFLFIILVLLLVLYVLFGIYSSRILYKKILSNIDYNTKFNSLISEVIDMLNSIKNLCETNYFLNKINDILDKYLKDSYILNNIFNRINLVKDILLDIGIFIINSLGIFLIIDGHITLVDLFTFNILLNYSIDPVKNIINQLPKYNYIKASFSKIEEFINIKEDNNKINKPMPYGDITIKGSFSYNNYDYIFKDINLVFKDGSHTFLKGNSGSGKSTICKIIYGEYFLTKGEVLFGKTNIKKISLPSVRKNILYVSQDEKLFTATIKENILLGRNVCDELLDKVVKICKVDEILNKKFYKYDSLIEANSKNLSGGEKQRIILARGLLKDAKIIILDEALSEVSLRMEEKIISNIRKYFTDKTIIYISHKNVSKSFENIIKIK